MAEFFNPKESNWYKKSSTTKKKSKPNKYTSDYALAQMFKSPNNGYKSWEDSDGDGLKNYAEGDDDYNPQEDSDGDGLADFKDNDGNNPIWSVPKPKAAPKPQTNPINFDKYRTQLSSIEDIQKKYGFNYSREYAKRQAEAERQAKQDGLNATRNSVESNVVGSADALDRNYFQKYMQQAQSQTNNGLNGGIAADQNLRMSMNRQAEMGDIYRDANNAYYEIDSALGRLAQEALVREDSLYNQRRQQGFENILAEGRFNQSENLAMLQAALSQRGQNIDMSQFSEQMDLSRDQFDESIRRSDQQQENWESSTNWQRMMDTINNALRQRQQNFSEDSFWSRLSGYLPNGDATMSREQMQFNNDLAIKQFNRPYEQLTAYQQTQINQAKQDRAAALQRAILSATRSGNGSGGSSNGTSNSSGGSSWGSLSEWEKNQVRSAYATGTQGEKEYISSQYPDIFGQSESNDPVANFSHWDTLELVSKSSQDLDLGDVSTTEIRGWVLGNVPAANRDAAFKVLSDENLQRWRESRNRKQNRSNGISSNLNTNQNNWTLNYPGF